MATRAYEEDVLLLKRIKQNIFLPKFSSITSRLSHVYYTSIIHILK